MVVVVCNMAREAPRTLYSLSAAYQGYIDPGEYEVIVVDNGSDPPFDPKVIEGLSGNFKLIRIDAASSPAAAVNRGIAETRGEIIGVMIDGASIATPGLLHFARHGVRLYDRAVVTALGWQLGYDLQCWATKAGYEQTREDALLTSIDWPNEGYRLFEVATMDSSSLDGWLMPIAESNALFMRRKLWDLIGGMDERLHPGNRLMNLEIFRRATAFPKAKLVVLLGEATFHQLNGGTATNVPTASLLAEWGKQYEAIHGSSFSFPEMRNGPTYLGAFPQPVLARFVRAAIDPFRVPGWEPPLGPHFDQGLWSLVPAASPAEPTIAALVDLAQKEFQARRYESAAAVSRLARERAPEEPEPQRLLSLIGSWLPHEHPPADRGAEYHCGLGQAYRLLGENEAAAANYRAALTFNPDLPQAHHGLAELRMPGDGYLVWLERLYDSLAPETVIEIGICMGNSLALVRPPTIAIGIDPVPTLLLPVKAETHIFVETSDEFFAQRHFEKFLAGRPLSVAFIDGLHLYEQALRDFINLEACCESRSLILIHDTFPLDAPTQSRIRNTVFHTGDVWKTVLCLEHYRPELDIFTIPTPPTGLTVVTGLDPASRVLTEGYDEAVARFIDTPFSAVETEIETMLNVVPNDWNLVQLRLKERGVL